MPAMTPKERFLRAVANRETDRPPVWLMRQAGRYLPEYRQIKAGHATKEMMRTPQIAREITLQPVRRLGVDAAILYSDILMIPDALGQGLDFAPGEGPKFSFPIDGAQALKRLNPEKLNARLDFVFETVRLCVKELPPDFPLLGFAGAPFTVACYMIAGGTSESFAEAKKLAWEQPAVFRGLMDVLVPATVEYLAEQAKAGVAAVQLFDTWAGLLSAEDYRALARPYAGRVFSELKARGVPAIYYVKNGAHLLDEMNGMDCSCLSVDWRVPLGEAVRRTGGRFAMQGNFDPDLLLTSHEIIERRLADMFTGIPDRRKGYIVNLGHGVSQHTPVENVAFFVKRARELGAK